MAKKPKTPTTTDEKSPRILDAKQAVAIASAYCHDLFPQAAKGNLMLEELERTGDGRQWLVTLGFDTGRQRTVFDMSGQRSYKTFSISTATGEVLSVKIRSVA